MGLGAAIGGIATIGGALIGSSAASDASDAQVQAANTASQTQLQMYNQTRSDLAPYMSGGSAAFSQLANIFGFGGSGTTGTTGAAGTTGGYLTLPSGEQVYVGGNGTTGGAGAGTTAANGTSATSGQPNPALATQLLTQFPGYQFGLDQGTQALDRSAASRGLVLSGAQLKDAQAYGTGYAQQAAWAPYVSELNSAASLGENAAAGAGNIGASTGAGVASSQLAAGQASAAGSASQGNIWSSALGQISPLISSYGPITGGTSGAFSSLTSGSAPGISNNIDYSGLTTSLPAL